MTSNKKSSSWRLYRLCRSCVRSCFCLFSFSSFWALLSRWCHKNLMHENIIAGSRNIYFSHWSRSSRSLFVPRYLFLYSSSQLFRLSFLLFSSHTHALHPRRLSVNTFTTSTTKPFLFLRTYHTKVVMSKEHDPEATKAMDANQDVQPPPPSYAATSAGNSSYAPPAGAPPSNTGEPYYQAQPVGGQGYAPPPGGYAAPSGYPPQTAYSAPAGAPGGYAHPGKNG